MARGRKRDVWGKIIREERGISIEIRITEK